MALFKMPSLGADMEAGTLVEWLVGEGETVRRGDIIAVVETQKGAIEIEVFENGTVSQLLLQPGETVPVGTPMAEIDGGAAGESAPAAPAPERAARLSAKPAEPERPVATAPPPPRAKAGERVPASPAARRLAAEKGVNLAALKGSGPGGAIVSADVLAAEQPAKLGAAPSRRGLDMDEMRKAIAAAMARSKREIPHYYLQHSIDLEAATTWLAEANAERTPPERLLMAALFVKATALALKQYPEFNGHFVDGRMERSESVHLGVAVAIRGGGLIAPAIHDADTLDVGSLMAALKDVTARMRAGRVRSSELTDPTATFSSLGDRGVEGLWGVIYPPQVALVGFGKVLSRPAVINDQVVPRPQVQVSLSGDHRANDGHRGALLLNAIDKLLQSPEAL